MKLNIVICSAIMYLGALRSDAKIVNFADSVEPPPAIDATLARAKPRNATTNFLGNWQPRKNQPVLLLHIFTQDKVASLQLFQKRGTTKNLRYDLQQTRRVGEFNNYAVQIETAWTDSTHQTPALILNFQEREGDGYKYILAFTHWWKAAPVVFGDVQYFTTESPF